MFIQTEPTPNPAALKFLPGRTILAHGTLDIRAKDADTVATIKELLETRVRPAVENDGGDITFRGFKDGVVYLDMKGACSGCPSSTATLRHGIQNLLRHYLPDVVEVRPM